MGPNRLFGIAGVFSIVCVVIFGLLVNCARAEVGPPIPKEKKIIGFAPDLVGTRYLKDNIAELERIPIDGLIINVWPEGGLYAGRIQLVLGGKYRREDYEQVIADLKETKFNHFTDNFIDFSLCASNAYDWFDDKWSIYAENAGVLAYVAKESGLKGLVIDVEQYGGMNVPVPYPLSYTYRKDRSKRSLDEVSAQVRKRGREMMTAITTVYPDITIIIIPNLGWGDEPVEELISSFTDGLLEGIGQQATLIDGMENAYPLALHESFSALRQIAEKTGIEKSKLPDIYKKKVQYGLGFWVDFDARFNGTYNGWRTDPKEFEKNYRSPERLEHSLYNALTVSDKYVWLFAIHPQYWWQPHLLKKENVAKQMEYSEGWRCVLCPHPEIPEEYIEAFRNCRKPHDLKWAPERARSMEEDAMGSWCLVLAKTKGKKPEDLLAKGKKILLNNSDFESWGVEKGNIPDAWNLAETHRKFVTREDTIVKEGSHSLKVSSKDPVSGVYLSQSIPADKYIGKTITFGVWIKANPADIGNINVIDFIETTGRRDEVVGKYTRFEGKDGWRFITATKTIRPNATHVAFYLDSSFPIEGVIYYDGAIAVVEE